MQKICAIVLLGIGAAAVAMAIGTPEIEPASSGSAVALLAGTLLVIRSRRSK
jgi:hypothetical protein